MALLDAKCTNCGATLKVDGGLDAASCEFCGAAFIVEKAVQNFYVNIQAQNVIVQGGIKEDFVNSVINIKYGAFWGCGNLGNIIFQNPERHIHSYYQGL